MPEKETMDRANEDKRKGDAPSTQAGEFVREEIHHVREGKHGARSSKQAIAIGLSKARRAGVDVPPAKSGSTSKETRRNAQMASRAGHDHPGRRPSAKRSRATSQALKREGHSAASHKALSGQARSAARKRTESQRSAAGRKAARTRAAQT